MSIDTGIDRQRSLRSERTSAMSLFDPFGARKAPSSALPDAVVTAKSQNPECSFAHDTSSLVKMRGHEAPVKQQDDRWYMMCPGEPRKLIYHSTTGSEAEGVPAGFDDGHDVFEDAIGGALMAEMRDFVEKLGGNGSLIPPPHPFSRGNEQVRDRGFPAPMGGDRAVGNTRQSSAPGLAEKERDQGVYI